MPYLSGCDFARKIATEINTAITIIIITAVTDIGINPLKLQVYFKPLLMSKLIDLVKKNAWCLTYHNYDSISKISLFYNVIIIL